MDNFPGFFQPLQVNSGSYRLSQRSSLGGVFFAMYIHCFVYCLGKSKSCLNFPPTLMRGGVVTGHIYIFQNNSTFGELLGPMTAFFVCTFTVVSCSQKFSNTVSVFSPPCIRQCLYCLLQSDEMAIALYNLKWYNWNKQNLKTFYIFFLNTKGLKYHVASFMHIDCEFSKKVRN